MFRVIGLQSLWFPIQKGFRELGFGVSGDSQFLKGLGS